MSSTVAKSVRRAYSYYLETHNAHRVLSAFVKHETYLLAISGYWLYENVEQFIVQMLVAESNGEHI